MTKYKTREEWLEAAVEAMRPVFESRDYNPPRVRVSCSFPSRRATAAKSKSIGECWDSAAASDGIHQIFISPLIDSVTGEYGVLATLVHEVAHATVGIAASHGPKFKACALGVGLAGKMTCTHAGPDLLVTLKEWSDKLGEYPHAVLTPGLSGKKKQTTRLLKASCPECSYPVRVIARWVESVGLPCCPKHGQMILEEKDEVDDE